MKHEEWRWPIIGSTIGAAGAFLFYAVLYNWDRIESFIQNLILYLQ